MVVPGMHDDRKPVLVVAGLPGRAAAGVDQIAGELAEPGTVVVRHDLSELRQGVVRRIVHSEGRESETILELAHGCVSCTLRADLLPYLCVLGQRDSVRRIVLALDPAFEAEAVCQAIENVTVAGVHGRVDGPAGRSVRIEAVLTCVDARDWLTDATGDDTLADRGHVTTDDERTVAQLAVGQVEFADAVIAVEVGAVDALEQARLAAVLDRLVPLAPVLWVADPDGASGTDLRVLLEQIPADARRGRSFGAHAPLLRGEPPLDTEHGVTLIEFATDRPFHPERLHSALDVLFEGVVTARGRVWLATQPDEVVWLESAGGGLRVGSAGKWLAAMTESERTQADPDRVAMAALRWHPDFGDRDISLVILAHDAEPNTIREALHWALVDEDELRLVRRAPERVAQWEDPFGDWHEDPCEASEETRSVGTESSGPATGDNRSNER
ncbi:GTP-binding protein [Nocardia sp. CC201C]|uniref:ribosome hibernation factor-recruiting GTPase MRF n=1 Tax=Nocardia sp. CC201C TaxID=3044575 RepID=UPI0024A98817|nr:GTP-binding protein [Nocardia sp. CC201C]